MWKWICVSDPLFIREHHSFEQLDEFLTGHEDGVSIPGFRDFSPCEDDHEYWDDGEPCSVKNCKIPYIREVGEFGRLSDLK